MTDFSREASGSLPTCKNSVASVLQVCVRKNTPDMWETAPQQDTLATRELKCLAKMSLRNGVTYISVKGDRAESGYSFSELRDISK